MPPRKLKPLKAGISKLNGTPPNSAAKASDAIAIIANGRHMDCRAISQTQSWARRRNQKYATPLTARAAPHHHAAAVISKPEQQCRDCSKTLHRQATRPRAGWANYAIRRNTKTDLQQQGHISENFHIDHRRFIDQPISRQARHAKHEAENRRQTNAKY